ncbi:MAG: hypothetical protein JXQ73_22275 [Phycisphaerae bacterium]|nr:hypothetical protein [Phycisphaerae bacterium]
MSHTVTKAEINTEIQPETFTFEGMGAKAGARIMDNRQDSPTRGKQIGEVGSTDPSSLP